MQLYRWRGAARNFGDELNTLLWPRLLPGFFDDDPAEQFLGIGSVLDARHNTGAVKLVAGAGYGGYEAPPRLDANWIIHWVRGPRTARLLGLPEACGLGDPVMLLPEPCAGGRSIGFMPHFESLERGAWTAAADVAGITLIDPCGDPAAILAAIGACRVLLSEAMHGVIAADAMRVPWRAAPARAGPSRQMARLGGLHGPFDPLSDPRRLLAVREAAHLAARRIAARPPSAAPCASHPASHRAAPVHRTGRAVTRRRRCLCATALHRGGIGPLPHTDAGSPGRSATRSAAAMGRTHGLGPLLSCVIAAIPRSTVGPLRSVRRLCPAIPTRRTTTCWSASHQRQGSARCRLQHRCPGCRLPPPQSARTAARYRQGSRGRRAGCAAARPGGGRRRRARSDALRAGAPD